MRSEVKGPWFVSMRAWLDANSSRGELERMLARIPVEHRAALGDPLPSAWYSEEALASALHAVDAELTRGNGGAFVDLMDACTEIGVSRFFRVLLRLSTPRFVLRQVPTMWRQIRRGAGTVDVVDVGDDVEVRYQGFAHFSDPLYELLTIGSLRALLRTCTGSNPRLEVVRRAADALTVRVVL